MFPNEFPLNDSQPRIWLVNLVTDNLFAKSSGAADWANINLQ